MTPRRGLLLGVAALLSASALLAVAILVVGEIGPTEGRILATTGLLAGFGALTLPATVLGERGRARPLAVALASLAAAGAALAVAAVWADGPADLWRAAGSAATLLVAGGQVALMLARRRAGDPPSVRSVLLPASIVLVAAVGGMVLWLIWAEGESGDAFGRALGVLIVLDVLAVALQPLLARARAPEAVVRLALVMEDGAREEADVRGGDLPAAVATAVRGAESRGLRVSRVEVLDRGEAEGPTAPDRSAPAS